MSTRVVSWKEAADRKESVAREALVIPSSTWLHLASFRSVSPAAMRAWRSLVHAHDLHPVRHGAGNQVGGTGIIHPHLAHHLTDDDLNVLVVDLHALQTVHLLHLADQVVLHSNAALDGQDVLGIGVSPR